MPCETEFTFITDPTSSSSEFMQLYLDGATKMIVEYTEGYTVNMTVSARDLFDIIDRFDEKYFNSLPLAMIRMAEMCPETNRAARDRAVVRHLVE